MEISAVIKQSTDRAGRSYTRKRDTPEFKRSLKNWRSVEKPERVLNRMTGLGLTREVVDLAAAAIGGEAPTGFSPLERIIEQSQLISSAFLTLGAERTRAVGRIISQSGRGFGTGFLISPRLLITNNHVIDNPDLAARCRVQFDFVKGIDGSIGTTEAYQLAPDVFFITAVPVGGLNLDYTIVAVEPANADGRQLSRRGCIPLIETSGKLILGDLANIIQHPGGEAQQVAIRDSEVVTPLEHFIRYEADTQPGSSGSPVFNDLWQVGALHHSGVADEVRPGVFRLIDGGEWDTRRPLSHEDQLRMAARVRWIANEGVRISSIVGDVQARLRNDAAKLALFQEAVTERPPTPLETALAAASARDSSQALPAALDGRSVTWTLPLRVTVQLGPEMQLSLTGQAPAGVRVDPMIPAVAAAVKAADTASARASVDGAVERAARELSGVREVLEVRPGFVWRDGTMTDTEAVVVVLDPNAVLPNGDPFEALKIPQAVSGVPVDITVGGATAVFRAMEGRGDVAAESLTVADLLQEKVPEIGYEPPTGVSLDEISESMTITCHASPDDGWPVLREFLDGTSKVITLGMFDLTAPRIVDKFKELAARPGFKMNLAIQKGMAGGLNGSKKNDVPENEFIDEMQELMGDRFRQAFVDVSGTDRTFASAYHIKVAVRDHKAFWLSSGNMQSSNQPDIQPAEDAETTFGPLHSFNREWHVVVENATLATMFEKFILHDLKTAEKNPAEDPKPRNEAFLPLLLTDPEFLEAGKKAKYFPSGNPATGAAKIKIQPLLTPDNYLEHVVPLVKSAKKTLFIQNQSLSLLQPLTKNENAFLELFSAIRERQKAGVDVRMIFRVMPVDEDAARAAKDALVKFGLRKNSVFVQEHCHNKGVVVDSATVLLGSHNWTNQGAIANRDASLIIHNPDIARYFEEIFLFDWENMTREPKPPKPGSGGANEALEGATDRVRVSLEELVLGDDITA